MTEGLLDNETMEVGKSRSKRPARLLPYHPLFRERKNDTDYIRRFYGLPTNCFELSELGYTLNGFYLVKATENKISTVKDGDKMQVEPIFCAFKNQEGIYRPSNLIEKKVNVTFKNDGIHFRARLTTIVEDKK